MTTNLYIIIVTYNGMTWLSKCLKSCESYKVIVVDNHSNDGTAAFIQQNFPKVVLLQQDTNLGFGAANNIGISYALNKGADYLFLLNQDAYLEQGTIEKLIQVHKINTDFGILSPIHFNGIGKQLDYNFSKYIKENTNLQQDLSKHLYNQEVYELSFVNAAAWLLPRSTLEIIGGFDPIFHHYGEDVNYCHRVLYHHFKIGVVPEVYIYHDRAYRKRKKFKSQADELTYYERGLKQSWANINVEIESNVRIKKQIIVKTILKLILKLKFTEAKFNMDKYGQLKNVLPEVMNSRKKNAEIGLHYLNLKNE